MAEQKTKISLALKYRPQVWSDVVEQDAIKQILASELETGNLKRCLLFTGPAGCGKTTNARIFAKEIEKEPANIVEINCADHTGVDDTRRILLDPSSSRPMVGQYKVFILDEVHMLTVQAQNALLKLLEEPPSYCVYILCTTDPQKILGTILSRAFRYDFQLITHQGIISRLDYILKQEQQDENGCGIQEWDNEALSMIATASRGHLRDAITTLDKLLSFSKSITVEHVEKVLGITSYVLMFNVLESMLSQNQDALLLSIDNIVKAGMDLKLFCKNFLKFVLDINKVLILFSNQQVDAMSFVDIPETYQPRIMAFDMVHREPLKQLLRVLLELNSQLRWESDPRAIIETQLLLMVI